MRMKGRHQFRYCLLLDLNVCLRARPRSGLEDSGQVLVPRQEKCSRVGWGSSNKEHTALGTHCSLGWNEKDSKPPKVPRIMLIHNVLTMKRFCFPGLASLCWGSVKTFGRVFRFLQPRLPSFYSWKLSPFPMLPFLHAKEEAHVERGFLHHTKDQHHTGEKELPSPWFSFR